MNREAVMARWALLGQWWCVPVDQTPEEGATFLEQVRETLGEDFKQCPLKYIEDRLYGGFKCDEMYRRHVYFAVGEYSFLDAAIGKFWANHTARRLETRSTLRDNNLASYIGDGPFTEVVTA